MAIAFDNALQSQVDSSVTSVTRSFTVTGSDTCVVSFALSTSAANMSGVTYNGVSLTKITQTNRGIDAFQTEAHFLVNASTGANNMVWSNGSSATFVTDATSYSGVRTTSYTPASSVTTGSSVTISDTLVTTTANSWIVSCSRTGGRYPDATGTNYVREAYNTANGVHIGSSQSALSAGSNNVSFNLNLTNAWGLIVFELQEASTPAATFIPKVVFF